MTREEAIEIVKKHGISADGTKFESALRELIPELAESEDERIRKKLVEYHSQQFEKNRDQEIGLFHKDALAYLEKQKEQKPAEYEAMADLERTYFCNPDKLPKWLKDDIAKKELNAHTKGYNKGYKDAEKQYNESVAYHFPIMPTPPSGWGCDGTHCTNPHHDCINCPFQYSSGGTITTPNTASGTSTATLHGNTSATDGKPHNPSFTD